MPMQQPYQLYGTGDTDAAAMIDVRTDGDIVAVYGTVSDVGMAGGDEVTAELSFGSVSMHTTNDATQVIARATLTTDATAAGLLTPGEVRMENLKIPVAAGERLYLHLNGSTANTKGRFIVVIDEKGTSGRSPRRR